MSSKNVLKIVILVVLIGVFIYGIARFVGKQLDNIAIRKNDDIITDMLIIQGKCKVLNGNIKVNNIENGYIGECLTDVSDENLKNKFANAGINEENYGDYFLLHEDHLQMLNVKDDLNNVKDCAFIVNYKECDVFYLDGFEFNGSVRYRLSDIEDINEQK